MNQNDEPEVSITSGMLRERLRINKDVKTVFCFEFIHQKFKCIVLVLLIIILCLEIVKAALPSMSVDDQKYISNGMVKAAKIFAKALSKHFNVSSLGEDGNISHVSAALPTPLTPTTTSGSLEYG